jgi:hypothetical protein
MHWGHYIFIACVTFMSMIIGLVYLTFQQNVDLVTENYYAEELVYQQRINAINVASQTQVNWQQQNEELLVSFPSNQFISSATVHLFRPANQIYDRVVEVEGTTEASVSVAELPSGYYRLKMEWISEGITYYKEEQIYLN